MNLSLYTSLIVGLFLSCSQTSFAAAKYSDVLPAPQLIKELQSGGYIIYMRHGISKRKDKKRKKIVDLSRCETQRNLTPAGVAEVIRMGKAMVRLKIPIGSVSSSPYCRTKDTAKAVFGRYVIDNNLAFSIGKMRAESKRYAKYLYDAMLNSNINKKNTVFVGHTANLKDGLGIWPKPEGVAVIFKKEGNKVIYKGIIKPTDWFK